MASFKVKVGTHTQGGKTYSGSSEHGDVFESNVNMVALHGASKFAAVEAPVAAVEAPVPKAPATEAPEKTPARRTPKDLGRN